MQTIYLDISNKGVTPRIYAKQSDVGRKFVAVMTDGGVPFEIPEDALISIWYEGASGSGNYTDIGNESAISVSKNLISVELIHQMLAVPGCGEITIVVNSADGKQIGFWNIQYDVERVAGWGSESAKDYFSAFSNATENLVEASRLFLPDKTLTQKGRPAEAYEAGLRISALEGRVNELSSLPDGSTTGDAELADARVGYDGETYENVGEHIRDIEKLAHNTSFAAENLVGNIPILVSRQKDSDGGLARRYTTEMKLIGDAKYLDHIEVPVLIDRVGGYSGVHNSVVAVANGRISRTEPIAHQWIEIPDGESSATAVVSVGEWFLPGDTIIVSVLDASTSGILRYPCVTESLELDWLDDMSGDATFPDGGASEYEEVRFVGTATFYDTIKNDAKTYISYKKQSPTAEQQAQARENIGITSDERYYPDLANAINDVNNGTTEEAITNISVAKVKVFTAENGRLTVMLLDDVSESSQIAINKDIDLVLNGKTLTFTAASAYIDIATDIICNIYGEVSGSAIVKDCISTSGATRLINTSAGVLNLFGGRYAIVGDNYATIPLRVGGSAKVVVDGCEINAVAVGTGANAYARPVQSSSSELLELRNTKLVATAEYIANAYGGTGSIKLTNCSATINSEVGAVGFDIMAATKAGTPITIDNCNIVVTTHDKSPKNATNRGSAIGISLRGGTTKIVNSKILADAYNDDAADEVFSTGVQVIRNSVCYIKDSYIFGTFTAVNNREGCKVYVSGGVFTGHSHGGFYFSHGVEGEAFVKDAVIRCGNYEGIFVDEFAYGNTFDNLPLAGFYVGGGANENNSNVTVYLDGCTIGYPGKPASVLRGTDGEQNCTVNISNSTIVDGALPIRVDNETHNLNVGIGTNITTDKITNPQWAEFTGLNYRRYNDEETVGGKDCAALSGEISRILNRLGGIINAEEVAY